MRMKCSVYIATSADGFIATQDGSVDWLDTAGNVDAEMGNEEDMGFNDFMDSVDCLVMGRGCMEKLASFNLSPDQWPYGNARVIALSNSLKQPPDSLRDKVEMYSGDLLELVINLEKEGYSHAYIDGGKTIQSFLALKLINEMTLTRVPLILGDGIPLFGRSTQTVRLKNVSVRAFPNDFVQLHYSVNYE